MPQEQIIIKFKPQGDKALDHAIKQLHASQTLLEKGSKEYQRALNKLNLEQQKAVVNTSVLDTRNKRLAQTNGVLANSFATLRSKMLLFAFGSMLVERTIVSLVKIYARQEAANEKLRIGLSNVQGTTEGVTQRLVDYSSALQQATAFGDEMITTGMVQFTTFGLNEQAIKALTPQVLNVARAIQTVSGQMPDLNSLFIAFGKATSTGIGTLTRYGVVLTENERVTLEAMDAIEAAVKIAYILVKQYGGLAEAYAKTTAGMLEAAAAARGDAAEAFGRVLAPSVVAVSSAMKTMFEIMNPAHFARITSAVISFGLAFGTAKTAVLLYNIAIKKSIVSTLSFNKAIAKNPIGFFATAASLAAVALGEYFGLFDYGNKVLTDAQKRQIELIESASELAKKQEESVEKLQQQLDLLNATNEEEKMRIKLGHEASAKELELISAIVSKTEALRAEKEIMKELEKQRKNELKLFNDIADVYDRNRLLKLELNDGTEKELALLQEEIRFKSELEKVGVGINDGNLISLEIGREWSDAEQQKIKL